MKEATSLRCDYPPQAAFSYEFLCPNHPVWLFLVSESAGPTIPPSPYYVVPFPSIWVCTLYQNKLQVGQRFKHGKWSNEPQNNVFTILEWRRPLQVWPKPRSHKKMDKFNYILKKICEAKTIRSQIPRNCKLGELFAAYITNSQVL